MNIYQITIGTNARKGNLQEHTKFIIKSNLTVESIQAHFIKQYKGFMVVVKKITENVIEIKEGKKKETVSISDRKIEESQVIANYSADQYSDLIKLKHYKALVSSSDLPRWKEFDAKQKALKDQLLELRKNYEKFVKEGFEEIKDFNRFEITDSGVKFEFTPSSFKLKLKAQIDTKIPVEDLPF